MRSAAEETFMAIETPRGDQLVSPALQTDMEISNPDSTDPSIYDLDASDLSELAYLETASVPQLASYARHAPTWYQRSLAYYQLEKHVGPAKAQALTATVNNPLGWVDKEDLFIFYRR